MAGERSRKQVGGVRESDCCSPGLFRERSAVNHARPLQEGPKDGVETQNQWTGSLDAQEVTGMGNEVGLILRGIHLTQFYAGT